MKAIKAYTALIVEDNKSTANAILQVAHSLGYKTLIAHSLNEARAIVKAELPEMVLLDLELPDEDGVELIREFVEFGVEDYIVISAATEQKRVLESLRAGATEFLAKPVRLSEIRAAIVRAEQQRYARLAGSAVPSTGVWIESATDFGDTQAANSLQASVEYMAQRDALRMLISGETGTDKRSVAAAVHEHSTRLGPLVVVNCSEEVDQNALARFLGKDVGEQRVDAKLSGYFQQAHGGTLVLDDVSQLPQALQSMLVSIIDTQSYTPENAIQAQPLNCAVICIVREPLSEALTQHRLTQDLYYSLSTYTLHVSNITERFTRVSNIAESMVQKLNITAGRDKSLTPTAVELINDYHWPGNLIELRNVVRAAFHGSANASAISVENLSIRGADNEQTYRAAPLVGMSFRQVEEKHIRETLAHVKGNKTQAAELLGISVKTLYNRLAIYQ